MAAAPTPQDPAAAYMERQAYFERLRVRYNHRRYLWANITAGSFILAAGAALTWVFLGGWAPPVVGGAGFLLCGVAFVRQTYLDEAFRRYATLTQLCQQGQARLRREWDTLTLRSADIAGLPALNATDLDILGRSSLEHLLNTVTTPLARRRLLGWLLDAATPEMVSTRQEAVRELAPQQELRDELTLFGALGERTPEAQARFLAWAEDTSWLGSRQWLNWYSAIAVVALVGLALAQVVGLVPYPFWLIVVAANMVVMQISGKDVERQVERVAEEQRAYLPYIGLFGYLSGQRFAAPLLVRVHTALAAEGKSAEAALHSLASRMRFADVRRSIIGPALQLGLLWNVHALRLLEHWRKRFGGQARTWFDLLAELEALSGLAALAFDNPDWAYPTITQGVTTTIQARGLGHPLLPPDRCIGNDVTLGPGGTFLLVTGSNMSGKSTLLRAIGLNISLAQAGAPVCASAMRLPPASVMTSMRIEDSLAQGVSYFMAELLRLKVVVDELRQVAVAGDRLPVFLLDEILSGTNSGERRIAARAIIHTLLAMGATGVVSTHDLSLVEEAELRAASVPAHFTERFTRGPDGPAMSFDYILRDGVASTVNALALMEIAGLPMEFARQDANGLGRAEGSPGPVVH
jgi:hypothetical protein